LTYLLSIVIFIWNYRCLILFLNLSSTVQYTFSYIIDTKTNEQSKEERVFQIDMSYMQPKFVHTTSSFFLKILKLSNHFTNSTSQYLIHLMHRLKTIPTVIHFQFMHQKADFIVHTINFSRCISKGLVIQSRCIVNTNYYLWENMSSSWK